MRALSDSASISESIRSLARSTPSSQESVSDDSFLAKNSFRFVGDFGTVVASMCA